MHTHILFVFARRSNIYILSFILIYFSDEFILFVTLIFCRFITRSMNVPLPVWRANVLNSWMHSCVLSSDWDAYDYADIDSLSLLPLSVAVQGGAHSASNSLIGRSQSAKSWPVWIWLSIPIYPQLNKSLDIRSINKLISSSSDESR